MKALLLTSLLLLSLPAHAAFWPFNDRCDDIEAMVAEGEIPSLDDAKYYTTECSGEKMESLGDSAAETAEEAQEKAADLWESLKEKVSE